MYGRVCNVANARHTIRVGAADHLEWRRDERESEAGWALSWCEYLFMGAMAGFVPGIFFGKLIERMDWRYMGITGIRHYTEHGSFSVQFNPGDK